MRPFYLGVFPVTQEQYRKVTRRSPSDFRPTGDNNDRVLGLDTRRFPVDNVSWNDAVAFCQRLSALPAEKKLGRTYRLPSEAEWEYACRESGGSSTAFHFGPALSSAQANFDGNFPYGGAEKGPYLFRTTEVGSYPPNALGLYDVHGNLREWCLDWYGPNYYAASPRRAPTGPREGTDRVVRGGNWVTYGWSCRSAARDTHPPEQGSSFVGFRALLVID
jgi:formylglycine-generating enzyme required for sulfatase activity